ncbi:Anaerobic dimethyl sulfoxide reductase chain A [Pseudonocardia sp. Ae168_Ps1]|nr:Anaerobic dimethyl sulfoxide reductase chain A [Pseudonocardia sp. Ae150A_Ps1]OLL77794.1 Anaerobic dimethyl sulfoxide reductase chain A [Pseudonocardia sp. Ae168_Ps1]OLL88082.1 Anaerobic dimethyl sulfoxide reductase chain A [Pseudonocardia sp. Ae263_Ps1]OLL91892.1 Anaerobic dimethyl sulfoxide reductase chain A [Pseudonocardia sp. Ae356_Ps1]
MERGEPDRTESRGVIIDAEKTHSAHWGVFTARYDGRRLRVRPHPGDPDPSPVLDNIPSAVGRPARVAAPAVRRGWWERGPGRDPGRGRDGYRTVSWEAVLDRLAEETHRVRSIHGDEAVYGGSYGWASAGRFHHAQGQLHRFLAVTGGYTRSVNSYSGGAAEVLLPQILGGFDAVTRYAVTWDQVAAHTDTVLAFGGMALKNSGIAAGGVSRHVERGAMRAARDRGAMFVLVSPLRPDLPEEVDATWLPIRPGTDVALMLALMHTVVAEGRHDTDFLASHCDGWETLREYLFAAPAKDAAWASAITGIDASAIRELAWRIAYGRTLVTVAQSLQRAEHGEQPVWGGTALAAVLGQIGLPGGGFNYGLGSLGHYGRPRNAVPVPSFSRAPNPVNSFIPVARVADMLLHPGGTYDYDGAERTYPHVRMAWWAGGNPFHHHQDLRRLRRAVAELDTFVVHDPVWTATARHADVVLPSTMTIERDDIGATSSDALLVAMKQLVPVHGEARDDYDVLSALAHRLGHGEAFTEGRTAHEWLVHMYDRTRKALADRGEPAPDFDEFWERGELELPRRPDDGGVLARFRADPEGHPLPTPSGRVQVGSATIAGHGYDDCPGHPAWREPTEAPDERHPFWLVSNQPATRLHSQLDFGAHSSGSKRSGREVVRIHPDDAGPLGIADGDVVRLHNDRGATLAAARLTGDIRPGVLQLPTGAWWAPTADPERPELGDDGLCAHGNPNAVTRDRGSSRFAQGCTGQLCAVAVSRFDHPLPAVEVHRAPGVP